MTNRNYKGNLASKFKRTLQILNLKERRGEHFANLGNFGEPSIWGTLTGNQWGGRGGANRRGEEQNAAFKKLSKNTFNALKPL